MVERPARWRRWVVVSVSVLTLVALALVWSGSLVPRTTSVMAMGVVDTGGAPAPPGTHGHGLAPDAGAGTRSVVSLTAPPDRPADLKVTLVAREERLRLASGREVSGFTLNGTSPGPEIRAVEGQLVEVRLVNDSVPDGITLHWHGVDVPNAEDGVAGVTQDAVGPGQEHTYRFVVDQVGTFWYHSHQVSHEQVRRGLLGALVVLPRDAAARAGADLTALVHLYDGRRTVDGLEGEVRHPLPAGTTARVRVVNTDNGAMSVWVTGAPLRLVAVDGTDLVGPPEVHDRSVRVTAGGRADLEVVVPTDGTAARVVLGGTTSLVLGPEGSQAPAAGRAPDPVDLLTYGTPAPVGAVAGPPDRTFQYLIGRRPGLVDGRPGLWWTVNGRLYPDVPMFVVAEGDVVRMHIANSSGDVHPMHLHGHHVLVLARDGVPSTGSPWWVDSLDVADGESYDVAFVADNPGIWMDHCHNLPHAAQGLVAHLAYEGVTTPFRLGDEATNRPE